MDYHAGTDALVVGGSTWDTGVWGSNPTGVLPSMLSLYKGPSMAQQWALTTSMVNHISLVAFSTDGQLIITQSFKLNPASIMIFTAASPVTVLAYFSFQYSG
jgi:hypothetical protein